MRSYITIDVLVNWALMLRADVDGAIIVIDDEEEGRFYEKIIHKSARILPAFQLAPALIEELVRRGVQGVVRVVRGPTMEAVGSNVFCPEIGDVASLMLASKNCEQLITDICGAPWVKACQKEIGSILERAVDLARLFEQIRSVFVKQTGHELEIQTFVRAVNWESLKVDSDGLRLIFGDGDVSEAEQLIESLNPENLSQALRKCDGNNAVHMLAAAIYFFKPRGISAERKVEVGELMALLRAAFELQEIENDNIFWVMKKWERDNSRYALLKEWRTFDSLGVLWDQRYWEMDLARFVMTLSNDEHMAVLKIDLDNFKAVNDELGHAVGDEAIRLYCTIIKEIIEPHGHVYRRGGDEVVAILPTTNTGTAQILAESIRAEVESQFQNWAMARGLAVPPTASVGLVVSTHRPSSEITKLLDDAQKRAKTEGKNRVVSLGDA